MATVSSLVSDNVSISNEVLTTPIGPFRNGTNGTEGYDGSGLGTDYNTGEYYNGSSILNDTLNTTFGPFQNGTNWTEGYDGAGSGIDYNFGEYNNGSGSDIEYYYYYYEGSGYDYYDYAYNVALDVRYYCVSIFSFIGVLANILCLLVILSSKLRGHTTGVYMAGLAVADFMVLFSEIIFWVNSKTVGTRLVDKNHHLCQAMFLIRYGSKTWSTLITIMITVERFFVVSFPLKVKNMMTLKVSLIVVLVSAIFAYSLNFFGAFTTGLVQNEFGIICDVQPEHEELYGIMYMTVLTGIGEFFAIIVIFLFSVLIIYKLLKARKFRQSMGTKNSSKEIQVTAMVLAVAVIFLVCKIPYTVAWSVGYFGHYITKTMDYDTYTHIYNIHMYLYNLTVLNHSVNFFMYVIFGSNFREALAELLCCGRQKPVLSKTAATSVMSLDEASKTKSTNNNFRVALADLLCCGRQKPVLSKTPATSVMSLDEASKTKSTNSIDVGEKGL